MQGETECPDCGGCGYVEISFDPYARQACICSLEQDAPALPSEPEVLTAAQLAAIDNRNGDYVPSAKAQRAYEVCSDEFRKGLWLRLYDLSAALRARCAQLEGDAARYRYLRGSVFRSEGPVIAIGDERRSSDGEFLGYTCMGRDVADERIDAAIARDAARSTTPTNEGV